MIKSSVISNQAHHQKSTRYLMQNNHALFFKPFIQPKLTISQPQDAYEQEADAVAQSVMQKPSLEKAPAFFRPLHTAVATLQKKCAGSRQGEKLQMKAESSGMGGMAAPPGVQDVINSKGSSLDPVTKGFMESRFGYDFGNVQVHNDARAHQSSAEINAAAYTHQNHISFGAGKYQPQTATGKLLLAHELAHVVQQDGTSEPIVSRAVDDNSSCSERVDSTAPPKPLFFLRLYDMGASSSLLLAIMKLRLDMMPDSENPSGEAFDAYKRRFGDPVEVKGKFKDRFDGTSHDSLASAQASEMVSLIGRLESVGAVLDKGINYQCIGTAAKKFGGCSFRKCESGDVLSACKGFNIIAICPDFWQKTPGEKGASIIHELFHIKFKFDDHDKKPFAQSSVQRLSEPECYSGFVGDVNHDESFDPSCPPL